MNNNLPLPEGPSGGGGGGGVHGAPSSLIDKKLIRRLIYLKRQRNYKFGTTELPEKIINPFHSWEFYHAF